MKNDYIFQNTKNNDKKSIVLQWILANLFNVWLNTAGFSYLLPQLIFFGMTLWLKYTGKRFGLTYLWRRWWHPTPVLLPGKSHWRRSLVGCSPWVAKSLRRLSDFTFTFPFHALEKEMATHWTIPGMGEPGGLPSMGSHRVGHDWSDLAAAASRDAEVAWIHPVSIP